MELHPSTPLGETHRMAHSIPIALFSALTAVTALAEPRLVAPDEVLKGDPIMMRVEGVEPGDRVLITCERRRRSGLYRSGGLFIVGPEGTIDIAADRPLVATWSGVDANGLFWSIRDSGEPVPDDLAPLVLRVHVDIDADGEVEMTREIALLRSTGTLIETPIGDALPGAFLLRPQGDRPLPCVILLGGSECNDSAARDMAPRLASRGFAVLGLPYCASARGDTVKGLPTAFAELPLETLEAALTWLSARPDISDRVGIWGVSKGAEFALLGASKIDGFSAIVAIAPSDVAWQGWGADETTSSWSWRGKPLPYVPYLGMGNEFARRNRGQPVRIRTAHDAGRLSHPTRVEPARIRVEEIDEPVMLVAGDADTVWDSGDMARNIEEARTAAGLETVLIVDADAGHYLSGDVFAPLNEPEARVRAEAFPRMVRFFAEHLSLDSPQN